MSSFSLCREGRTRHPDMSSTVQLQRVTCGKQAYNYVSGSSGGVVGSVGVEQVCDLCHQVTFDTKPLTSIRALESR